MLTLYGVRLFLQTSHLHRQQIVSLFVIKRMPRAASDMDTSPRKAKSDVCIYIYIFIYLFIYTYIYIYIYIRIYIYRHM